MKKLLIFVLNLAYLLLISGVALVAAHFYFNNKAANGGGIPAQAALQTVEGKVLEGREVTLETKRRRGVDSVERFYEFDIKPATGAVVKLRVDHSIERQRLEPILDETVKAQYDGGDDNRAYDISMNNQAVISYQEMAAKAQAAADKQAAFFGDGAMMNAGIWWIVLGALGVFFQRRLKRSVAVNTQQAVSEPKEN